MNVKGDSLRERMNEWGEGGGKRTNIGCMGMFKGSMTPTKHCKKRGEGGRGREYNGGVNLFKAYHTHVWNIAMKPPCVINV
jgi:hypothetical protein